MSIIRNQILLLHLLQSSFLEFPLQHPPRVIMTSDARQRFIRPPIVQQQLVQNQIPIGHPQHQQQQQQHSPMSQQQHSPMSQQQQSPISQQQQTPMSQQQQLPMSQQQQQSPMSQQQQQSPMPQQQMPPQQVLSSQPDPIRIRNSNFQSIHSRFHLTSNVSRRRRLNQLASIQNQRMDSKQYQR